MHVIKHVFVGLMLCGACSGKVVAAEPGFSFVEGGFLGASNGYGNDTDDENVNGARFNASIAMNDYLYLSGDYIKLDQSFGSVSFATLGLGAHLHLGSSLQMFSALSLVLATSDGHAEYEEEDLAYLELGLTAGLRYPAGEKLELLGSVRVAAVGDEVSIGARYYFNGRFAAGLDLTRHHYDTQVGLMLRYDFSQHGGYRNTHAHADHFGSNETMAYQSLKGIGPPARP